jgi:helicase MOV-10
LRHITQLGIPGDTILAQINGSLDDKWYEGHVHYVHEAEVGLRFNNAFHKHAMEQLDVRFQLNRVTLRRQHQALCAPQHAGHLLFPSPTHVALARPELSVTLYDPKIANNPRQFGAIKHILSLPSTSGPFIIFGP